MEELRDPITKLYETAFADGVRSSEDAIESFRGLYQAEIARLRAERDAAEAQWKNAWARMDAPAKEGEMSNIVERLRHWSKPDKCGNREGRADDFTEAAGLIDKLNRQLAYEIESHNKTCDRRDKLRAALANVYEELLGVPGEVQTARAMIREALAKEGK